MILFPYSCKIFKARLEKSRELLGLLNYPAHCDIYAVTMKFIFLLIVFLSFPVQTFAQTPSNYHLRQKRCSYDANGMERRYFYMLSASDYPWGVCYFYDENNNIMPSYYAFSQQEREWTRQAMNVWNTTYNNFKVQNWGEDVVNIPNGPLFVESCDIERYHIIYVKKDFLKGRTSTGSIHPLANSLYSARPKGSYRFVDLNDGRPFYGLLEMDSGTNWTKYEFINVLSHELGHGLALPHAEEGKSPLMYFNLCKKLQHKFCGINLYDLWTFIAPFGGWAELRSSYNKKREIARDECKGSKACYADLLGIW